MENREIYTIEAIEAFEVWFGNLGPIAAGRITKVLRRIAKTGNMGDVKSVG